MVAARFCIFFLLAFGQLGRADSSACATCHKAIAERFARSPMARSFGAARPLPSSEFRHAASGQIFSVFTRGGQPYLRRQLPGFYGAPAHVLERKIDYFFGSGRHAQSYISRGPDGLFELPISFYSASGGFWEMSPAYDAAQHPGFSRKITYRCMSCHNAYPNGLAGDAAESWPSRLPQGIDCQRCHGPGREHIAARGAAPIVNPARLPPQRRLEVCLQCHLETTSSPLPNSILRHGRSVFSYLPGEPLEQYAYFFDHAPGHGHDGKLELVGAPYRLAMSKCFTQSQGALQCTTCHDPHGGPPRDGCRTCHPAADALHRDKGVSTGAASCHSCHMPKRRPADAIHITTTDHHIQRIPLPPAPRPEPSPYKGPVVLYYPRTPADASAAELYTAAAQIANQANMRDGIPRLQNALTAAKSAPAQFFADLANAYRLTAQPEPAAEWYRRALSLEPANWSALFGLGLITADAKRLHQAAALAPWNTEIPKALASNLAEHGSTRDALAVLRAAITANPNAADLYNNLATTLLRTGDTAGAETALREAARLRPEVPSILGNLATLLARKNEWPEAAHTFEQALSLDPQSAEIHSAFGIALASRGDLRNARQHFESALQSNPQLANTRNNLGALLERSKDPVGAAAQYRAALAIRPDFPAALYNLAVLLTAQNDLAEAESLLRTAIAAAPGHADAHAKLGELLCRQNRCQEGTVLLEKAAKLRRRPEPLR